MTRYTLNVFDADSRVGQLDYESLEEQFSFDYDAAWRDAKDSYSISPHILLNGPSAPSSTVRRFVENLLPEGRALDIVSTTYQVSKNNIYGLIRELGQETAGALSFRSGDASGRPATLRREVTRAELAQRIAERAQVPFAVWDGRVRMSIAGYQDKLAVYTESDRLYLVEGELASTHILKPEPLDERLHKLVANEHYCMKLAAHVGVSTAEVSILRLPTPVLVVKRFDRSAERDSVRRLHIVDACQALNFPVAYKYERNFGSGRDVRDIREGVSFSRTFSLAEYTVEKAVTRQSLVRWALFQYLIGNADAHGKNVSFFCGPSGLSLTPAYDLVSVVQYPHVAHELAMAFGDEFSIEAVRPYDFAEFAQGTKTPRLLLAREMKRLAKIAGSAAVNLAESDTYSDDERAVVRKIAAFVEGQAKQLNAMAEPMLGVDEHSL
ncbi:MAG: HipA domain-containing protein [Gammaproteobacteria bacterium]